MIKKTIIANIIITLGLFLFFIPKVIAQTASCGAADVAGILAEWNFANSTPAFKQGLYFYEPDVEADCVVSARLGSPGHANTYVFKNAICLLNFYNPTFSQNSYGGAAYDPDATTFDPEGKANLIIDYTIPAGKASCLSDFSLDIIQKQFDGATVNFEKQGVAVKRNGYLIDVQTQNITAANINGTAMTFNFSGDDFCSNGLAEVKYEIIFGLVHRLVPAGSYTSPATTGYDNFIIRGTCGGPAGYAQIIPQYCAASGTGDNGGILLQNFDGTVRYDFNIGSTYTGAANYASATPLPANKLITSTIPNPAADQDYTVRIFDVSGCYEDKTVTFSPVACPAPCNEPGGMTFTVTETTCTGATSSDNASIQIIGVTNGDKVQLSATGAGFDYSTANVLARGAFTYTNLPNPTGAKTYTLRFFNGSSSCYRDVAVLLEEIPCGPCSNALIEIVETGGTSIDSDSSPNNGDATEDDQTSFESCKSDNAIDLTLSKTVNVTTGTVGTTTFTYTITLTNEGMMDATNIQVADLLAADLYLTNAVPSAGTFGEFTGWQLTALAAGQSATLTMDVIALKGGSYNNCAFVNTASPDNDPDSTPGNDETANEDDDDCANMITVTGTTPPSIAKEFSPMNVKTGTNVRLIFKITNNESTDITLTSDFIDNLPSSPAQMVIAAHPNLQSTITNVLAIAGGTSVTIPSGTVLPPGLTQIYLDVTVSSDGFYCNDIAVGDLGTSAGNNILGSTACIAANSTFVNAPVIGINFDCPTAGTTNDLTLTINNTCGSSMTVEEDAFLTLPSGLSFAVGNNTGTIAGITYTAGDTVLVLPVGTVLSLEDNTIIVPILVTTVPTSPIFLPMNFILVECNGITNLGNEDVPVNIKPIISPPNPVGCSDLLANLNSSGIVPDPTIAYDAMGSAFGCGTETMYPSPLITSEQAGSFATAFCSGAPAFRGLDESFQVVIGGDFIIPSTGGAEIEGRVAIGGNLQADKSYSLSESGGGTYVIGAPGDAVGVDGIVTGAGPISLGFNNSGATYNIVSGGANSVSLNNGTKIQNSNNLPLDVTAFMAGMTCLSADLRDATATASFVDDPNGGFFIGNNTPGTEIFTVDGTLLNPSTAYNSGYANIDLNATLVVNVSGTSVDLNYTVRAGRVEDPTFAPFGGGPLVYNVIWNFYEATSITLKTDFHGTIIAPLANVDMQGNFNGRLYIGGNLTHSGSGSEIHNYPFTGNLSAYCTSCSTCTNPTADTPTPTQGTCTGTTANNNATITLNNIANADIAGIVAGADYSSGVAYNADASTNAALETVTANTLTFSDLMHNTPYTIRVFNAGNDCFTDFMVTTTAVAFPAIIGIDTTICSTQTINLASLISGTASETTAYGTNFGSYPTAIATDVTVSSTTTYYVQDSNTTTMCVDTATILVTVNACDWGDLPDTSAATNVSDYQTLSANNGPVHVIIPGLALGSSVDGENDGQSSTDALGDGVDEDGLTVYPSLDLYPAQTFTSPFSYTNTTGNTAYVVAWIDWNADGDFDNSEMVADWNDGSGTMPDRMEVTIPSTAQLGTLLGWRIRISNQDNMTPYGLQANGEVEDYLIGIDCPQVCLPIQVTILKQ